MKVGIDARMIRYSGIGTYISELLTEYARLVGQASSNGSPLYTSDKTAPEIIVLGRRKELQQYEGLEISDLNVPIYSVMEQVFLPFKTCKIPLFHCPHYNAPILYGGKLVVTIHDIIHIKFPQYLPSKKAYLYARYMLRKVSRQAEKVITASKNSMEDLISELKVSPDKISVIPFGVNRKFKPVENRKLLLAFREKYSLPESFILYVGNLKTHKNLSTLLKAFTILKRQRKIPESLVLTSGGKALPQELIQELFKGKLQGSVKFVPFIPDDEMPLLYNCAKLFVFPSLYEGFGLSLLEAMACGVPVVSSDSSSLPEVVGDAGIVCDCKSEANLANVLSDLLENSSRMKALGEKGILRAKLFPWSETARRTLCVYEECL